jgi:hypothetical protein
MAHTRKKCCSKLYNNLRAITTQSILAGRDPHSPGNSQPVLPIYLQHDLNALCLVVPRFYQRTEQRLIVFRCRRRCRQPFQTSKQQLGAGCSGQPHICSVVHANSTPAKSAATLFIQDCRATALVNNKACQGRNFSRFIFCPFPRSISAAMELTVDNTSTPATPALS